MTNTASKIGANDTRIKFPLGQLVMTQGIHALVAGGDLEVIRYLARHASGDWGDMSEEDKVSNDDYIVSGGRIFSAYNASLVSRSGTTRIWIITNADRSETTILLPSEY